MREGICVFFLSLLLIFPSIVKANQTEEGTTNKEKWAFLISHPNSEVM
jgi:hypothetical protein